MSKAKRMADVLALLCKERPPEDLCQLWLDNDDRQVELQDWIGSSPALREELSWSMTVTIAEAAERIALEPRDDIAWLTGTNPEDWEK